MPAYYSTPEPKTEVHVSPLLLTTRHDTYISPSITLERTKVRLGYLACMFPNAPWLKKKIQKGVLHILHALHIGILSLAQKLYLM